MTTHRLSLCTESNAISKYTKWMYMVADHFVCLLQNIPEIKDLTDSPSPFPENCLLFLRACILLMRILMSTLLANGSIVTPFQLLHSWKLRFLGILQINPFVPS